MYVLHGKISSSATWDHQAPDEVDRYTTTYYLQVCMPLHRQPREDSTRKSATMQCFGACFGAVMLEASGTLGSSLLCLASSSTTEYTSLLLVGGADNPICPGAGIQYVSMVMCQWHTRRLTRYLGLDGKLPRAACTYIHLPLLALGPGFWVQSRLGPTTGKGVPGAIVHIGCLMTHFHGQSMR